MPRSFLAALVVVTLGSARAGAAPRALTSPAELTTLCADLRSPGGAGSKRQAALTTEWVTRLAPGQFQVAASDSRDGSLTLTLQGGFRLFDRKVLLTSVDDDDVDLALVAGQAEPSHPEALSLELVFRPGRASEPPCSLGLIAPVALSIEILEAKLVDKAGQTIAFLDSDVLGDHPTPAGGKPEVDIDPAQVEGSTELSDRLTEAMQTARPAMLGCFEHALGTTPTLDGLVVLGFALGKDGKPGPITVVADSVQDDAMLGCVLEKVKGATVKGKTKKADGPGGRANVTLRFERH